MKEPHSPRHRWVLIVVTMLIVFALDRSTGAAPVQHLYYVPIVVAAVSFGRWAGPGAAVGAVLLYHLANPTLFHARYGESDLVQIALFIASGVVAERFAHDARRLRRLSETDDLTGLYNLRGFEARLTDALRACRQARAPVSLLVLDVDRLKLLNDTYGHRAGADAVRLVGNVLATCLPPGAIGCRFGGDEFVVALPEYDASGALAAADILRQAVHACEPILALTRFPPAPLAISIGLACLFLDADDLRAPERDDDPDAAETLFRAADQALYAAKSAGRNRITIAKHESVQPRETHASF